MTQLAIWIAVGTDESGNWATRNCFDKSDIIHGRAVFDKYDIYYTLDFLISLDINAYWCCF